MCILQTTHVHAAHVEHCLQIRKKYIIVEVAEVFVNTTFNEEQKVFKKEFSVEGIL